MTPKKSFPKPQS